MDQVCGIPLHTIYSVMKFWDPIHMLLLYISLSSTKSTVMNIACISRSVSFSFSAPLDYMQGH